MNNKQIGTSGIVLIIILVLVLIGGGIYLAMNRNADTDDVNYGTNNVATTTATTSNSAIVKSSASPSGGNTKTVAQPVSKDDIANATYPIAFGANNQFVKQANFGAITPTPTIGAKGSVTVNPGETGQVNKLTEYFSINRYEYEDAALTKAKVTLKGDFISAGTEERIFLVTKTNSKITAIEIDR